MKSWPRQPCPVVYLYGTDSNQVLTVLQKLHETRRGTQTTGTRSREEARREARKQRYSFIWLTHEKMNLEKINGIGGRNTSIAQLQSVGRDDTCGHVDRAALGNSIYFCSFLIVICHVAHSLIRQLFHRIPTYFVLL